ncbi:hypothetical protein A2617_04820 [Candidatus Daviesbacteria bacterium RIFOXYD1_FULL_41_10]|uniref:Uncharacterized protein n=2 Tax=Candidatus Daviesiibacteriota TaxID=1752718 RepID=A0A1F5N3C1_9BACT|nr:MAG: hypothetical protein UU67_C0011G0015 [Candidatus Daviesbacteria bacterium GW2011_GWB1_41_5]OGE71970.1 MAG: hypothetical protein A2617_04820 [Candidatus Daviesbacteria bacterium RIFOXYD1_FULL_41_10]
MAQGTERHDFTYDVTTCGGGHGNSNLLWGITQFFPRNRVNSIVTNADDGGDSGKLSNSEHGYGVESPGDKRMCAMPLASKLTQPENNLLNQYRFTGREGRLSDYTIRDLAIEILNQQHETSFKGAIAFRKIFFVPLINLLNSNNVSPDLQKLMDYKFPGDKLELNERCFGNLVIAACELMAGNPAGGFEMFRRIFSVQGEIVSATNKKNPVLHAEFSNGEIIKGESKIGNRDKNPTYNPRNKMSRIYHDGEINPRAIYLLKNSFLRVISPGSPETSIIPVLATKGFTEIVEEANKTGGKTIVVPPVMNSEGTAFRDASQVIESYLSYLNDRRKLITDVILSATPMPQDGENRYAEYGQTKIAHEFRSCHILLPQAKIHLIPDLIDYDMTSGRVGHNQGRLGEAIYSIWRQGFRH